MSNFQAILTFEASFSFSPNLFKDILIVISYYFRQFVTNLTRCVLTFLGVLCIRSALARTPGKKGRIRALDSKEASEKGGKVAFFVRLLQHFPEPSGP